MTSDLDELVGVLRQIQALDLQGGGLFDGDPRQRWSIERPAVPSRMRFRTEQVGKHSIPDEVPA